MTGAEEHNLTVKGRKWIEVTGVSSVESFDDREFMLTTRGGPLHIQGSGLHIKHLDLEEGVVIIEGTLTGLAYVQEHGKKRRLGSRLFR
ncbi:MAG: sporulation protein YabP [Thermoflavifilum sp.]|nr:sporulation protein YabP [Thermoflavifilum sp.]MCL6513742.1 sporulation protein YabP [Alicyclobacillus sp.]